MSYLVSAHLNGSPDRTGNGLTVRAVMDALMPAASPAMRECVTYELMAHGESEWHDAAGVWTFDATELS